MRFTNKFPYTNINNINLDWIIKRVKELGETVRSYANDIANAVSMAEAAQEAADSVTGTAESAVATAQAAEETANAIAGTANTALATAQSAEETANAIAGVANTALSTAQAAEETAQAAEETAQAAEETAQAAEETAQAAEETANTAAASVSGAVQTANTALATADAASTSAALASASASEALTTANETLSTAEETAINVSLLTSEVSRQNSAINGIESSIATVETTSTASRAYAVGEMLVYGNRLYKVASVIAAGATLTPGANITQTTIENEIDGKQAEIVGIRGNAVGFDSGNKPIAIGIGDTSNALFSRNCFTTALNSYLVRGDVTGTRNGFSINGNQIIVYKTTGSSTTFKWASILSNDGTIHNFVGSYNDANIPIDDRAWISLDDVFYRNTTQKVRFVATKTGTAQKTGTSADYIYLYFGYKDESGITSKARISIINTYSNLSGSPDISEYINNRTDYNVFAIYFCDANRTGKTTNDIMFFVDLQTLL